MYDPITVIGATASILQLVQAITKGFLTVANAVKAIIDVYDKIQAISNRIEQLREPILAIKDYIESRPEDNQPELRTVISNVTTSCHASLLSCLESLNTIQSRIPKIGGSHQKIGAAIRMWIQDREMAQARKHVDGYLQNLALILPLMNLFKVNQVDAKLNAISKVLENTHQYRAVDADALASEDDRQTLEINVQIRAFATHMATDIAMNEPNILQTQAKPLKALASAPVMYLNDDYLAQIPVVKPGINQLNHELEANRTALKHLMAFRIYEGAVNIQRRAMEIKMLLARDPRSWEQSSEFYEMQEVLADLLLQRDSRECRQEALSILQRQVCLFTPAPHDAMDVTSTQAAQKFINLHLKLGQAFKETGLLDFARDHLRVAFGTCDSTSLKDVKKLQEIGEHLQEVYQFQVQDSDESQRAVRISQLQGFRNEMETALGRPTTEYSVKYAEALNWCETANIMVHMQDQRYRFDIMDPDVESSALHIAAEKCRDKIVLQQIIENSDTLENLNGERETSLLVAVENSNIEAVALLIRNRASFKARDKHHKTVLHKCQRTAVTRLLLQSRLRRNSSMSDYSMGSDRRPHRGSLSSSATTATGTTFSNSNLTPDDDLDIDAQDAHQKTPLWTACSAGRAKTVDLLLAAGADPNKPRYVTSPLAAVIESMAKSYFEDSGKRVRIVTALIHAGADPEPGKQLLLHKPKGIDHKQLLRALDASEDRSLLSPISTRDLTLPNLDFSKFEI